ncbi:LacI family DNA-binding transcriptional regulator [Thalassotalea litorea]|uniref:LacI family DNA-binding transcriptional regulator n=1 Tax=Thalassotalea litorea TaxID=2020715 RepID=UPI003735523A
MAIKKRTRIQDVAAQAKVSMMTVSRVLNQDAKVSDKTREKVMKVVKELNYRPNVSARRLASSKSFFLGLLYDNPSGSYTSQFLLSALKSCRAKGYHLIVDECSDYNQKTLDSIKELIEVSRVDGLILLPPICDNEEIVQVIIDANLPFIRIAPDTNLTASPFICMDDYQASFEVTNRLIEQGHRKIGFIIGHPDQGVSRLRYQGYLDALRSHRINVPPEYIEQGRFDYKSGLDAAMNILSLEDKPTAIFASNDDMAAAVLSAANRFKLDVPKKLSVVGFDDTQLASTIWPHLTTVRQPINEMAALAIDLLSSGKFADLSLANKAQFRHVLDFAIIERDSTQDITA